MQLNPSESDGFTCEIVTMAGIEGNEEMNVLKGLVNSLAQSVQTLTARQSAPTDQLKNLWS